MTETSEGYALKPHQRRPNTLHASNATRGPTCRSLEDSNAAIALARRWCAVVALAMTACGAHLPPAFVAEREQAETAYSRGDYRAAAQHWSSAVALSPNARERDEASYRRAASLERAGALDAADAAYGDLERKGGERSERAAFARGELSIRRGDLENGYRQMRTALVRFPNSGLARQSAARFLAYVAGTRGQSEELSELGRLLLETRGSELEEALLYARARWLENNADPETALAAYLAVADRYGYPFGAYWDDALLNAARLDRSLGRHSDAIKTLERLLAEREQSRLNGSYERPSYAEGRFLLAEIFRDNLRDDKRASSEFRRVYRDHPTSRLRDDALFEEALIALRSKDAKGACEVTQLLLRTLPESRFCGCARALCPLRYSESSNDRCPSYLAPRIDSARRGEQTPLGGATQPD